MRPISLFLSLALLLPVSAQPPVTPGTVPETQPIVPATPATSPGTQSITPATPLQGASSVYSMKQGHTTVAPEVSEDANLAPWVGSKAYIKQVFGSVDTSVQLRAPIKLRDFVVSDRLELSLKNYVDLVLANNTDIEIQRLSLEIPKNAIQRAFGIFDPFVQASFNATRATNPATNTLQGANIVSTLSQPFSARYQQTLGTGTQINSTFGANKFATNDTFQAFNPAYNTNVNFGFAQPLLRNRGAFVTKLPISIARSQRRAAGFSFEDQLLRLLVIAENAYWDVILARERIKVQEQALSLADTALKRAKRELELGATSPLEIYQPEQNYATQEIALTQVKYQLAIAEDTLRRQIGVDLDPEVRKLPIVLTERVEPTTDERLLDRELLVSTAVQKRPDLKSTIQGLDVNDLQIMSAENNLRPFLNLTGGYTSVGRGGPIAIRPPVIPGEPAPPATILPGGINDAFGQMFGFDFNTWAMGITLQLPFRDRAAGANLADAVVNKRLTVLRQRTLEQQIRQDVLTAISQVENSKASVRLAQVALDFAVKRAEADQKRYDLGVINIFFLLDAQNALTLAQSNLVNQTIQYRRNVLTLQQRTGTLLEDRGIVIQ